MPWKEFLWELPMHRALDMEHAAMHLAGIHTRWPEERVEEERAAARAVERIKAIRGSLTGRK